MWVRIFCAVFVVSTEGATTTTEGRKSHDLEDPPTFITTTTPLAVKFLSDYSEMSNSKYRADPVVVGTTVYAVPYSADSVLIIDSTNGLWSTLTGYSDVSDSLFDATPVVAGRKIYAFPSNASYILVINSSDNSWSKLSSYSSGYLDQKFKADPVLLGGKIYAIPYNAEYILVIDTLTDSCEKFSNYTDDSKGKYLGEPVVVGSKIYAVPCNARSILLLDTTDNTWRLLGSLSAKGFLFTVAPIVVGTKIYAVPYNLARIMVVDTLTDVLTFSGNLDKDKKKYGAQPILVGTKIYAVPLCAKGILIIDTSNDSVSTISDNSKKNSTMKYRAVPMQIGTKLYALPLAAESILIIDTTNDSVSTLSGYSGPPRQWKYSASPVQIGTKLFAVPRHAKDVLVIETTDDSWSTLPRYSQKGQSRYLASPVVVGSRMIALPFDADIILTTTPCDGVFNDNETANHFTANCSSATTHLAACSLTHSDGYISGSVTCDVASGQYNVVAASAKQCSSPPTFAGVIVTFDNNNNYGSIASFTCSDGGTFSGSATIKCDATSNEDAWPNPPQTPTCTAISSTTVAAISSTTVAAISSTTVAAISSTTVAAYTSDPRLKIAVVPNKGVSTTKVVTISKVVEIVTKNTSASSVVPGDPFTFTIAVDEDARTQTKESLTYTEQKQQYCLAGEPQIAFGEVRCEWHHPETGEWSSSGCEVVKDTMALVTCSCSHLTTFAVNEHKKVEFRDALSLEGDGLIVFIISLLVFVSAITATIINIKYYKSFKRKTIIITLALSIIDFLTDSLMLSAMWQSVITCAVTELRPFALVSSIIFGISSVGSFGVANFLFYKERKNNQDFREWMNESCANKFMATLSIFLSLVHTCNIKLINNGMFGRAYFSAPFSSALKRYLHKTFMWSSLSENLPQLGIFIYMSIRFGGLTEFSAFIVAIKVVLLIFKAVYHLSPALMDKILHSIVDVCCHCHCHRSPNAGGKSTIKGKTSVSLHGNATTQLSDQDHVRLAPIRLSTNPAITDGL